jgi:hypothetical protein
MIDRYFSSEQMAYQMVRNYWKHDNIIVACDYDDTLVGFHNKGDRHNRMVQLMQYLSTDKDRFKLILFTAREDEELQEAKDFCEDMGIEFDYFNESPVTANGKETRKPFYNVLFDDKAGLGQTYEAFLLFLKMIRDENFDKYIWGYGNDNINR